MKATPLAAPGRRYRVNGKKDVVFQPALMSSRDLLMGMEWAARQFYALPSIAERMARSRTGLWWNIVRNLGYSSVVSSVPPDNTRRSPCPSASGISGHAGTAKSFRRTAHAARKNEKGKKTERLIEATYGAEPPPKTHRKPKRPQRAAG